MSFLTAPTRKDIRTAEGLKGLLELKEVVPPGGGFNFPAGWPPTEAALYTKKRGHGLGGLGQQVTQGTWLSPSQVKGVVARAGAVSLPQGELETARQLVERNLRKRAGRWHKTTLGACGASCGMGQAQAQGTYLSPTQLPSGEVVSAKKLLAQRLKQRRMAVARRRSGGLGQAYVDPTAALKSAYTTGQITLPVFKTAEGKVVGQYAYPSEQLLKTAYLERQAQLPAFYQHPTLGPWGVDPMQAYQYWYSQLQAMQRAAYATPMSVWGSPGVTAYTPPSLPPSTVAQPAAFNPYAQAFPQAGTAVEKF